MISRDIYLIKIDHEDTAIDHRDPIRKSLQKTKMNLQIIEFLKNFFEHKNWSIDKKNRFKDNRSFIKLIKASL